MEKSDSPLVSVCISVYNGDKYLIRCLDSVINQDISSMEIVLVNDGSTDRTSQIMFEYQVRYPMMRIKIIEQENKGLAQARWAGVKNSNGKYITFLDADDFLLNDAYQTIVQFMKHVKADIYEFQTIRDDYYSKSPYTGTMEAKKVLRDYFDGRDIPVNYWLRWFKRSLFSETIFPIGISFSEDNFGFPCLIHRADTIAYIEKPLHVHTKNPDSIMNLLCSERDHQKYFEQQKIQLLSIPHIVANIGQDVIDSEYKDSFPQYVARVYRNFVFLDLKGISYCERLETIINTSDLKCSRIELERYITKNVCTKYSKMNRVIRCVGLHNAYRLNVLRNCIAKWLNNK